MDKYNETEFKVTSQKGEHLPIIIQVSANGEVRVKNSIRVVSELPVLNTIGSAFFETTNNEEAVSHIKVTTSAAGVSITSNNEINDVLPPRLDFSFRKIRSGIFTLLIDAREGFSVRGREKCSSSTRIGIVDVPTPPYIIKAMEDAGITE